MAEDSDLERTEPASSRRITQAREEGNVPQSRELSSFLVLMVGVTTLWVAGGWMFGRLARIAHDGLALDRSATRDPAAMVQMMAQLFTDGLTVLVPVFVTLTFAAVAGPLLIGGLNFSTKAMSVQLSRLNPMAGLARLFSVHGLVELAKAVLKAIVVGGFAVWVMRSKTPEALGLASMAVGPGIAAFAILLAKSVTIMVAGLALIASIDVPFQLWHYYSKLKMTKEELRQEHKEQEGDPQVKGRIRQRQREMARRRMMQEVPKADVIVTNPTHFAVALKYEGGTMRAPRVVAKGTDLVAQQIRELARAHQVPRLEAPPLARALYRHTEIGEEVPAALYTAVAEVLAWVFTLRHAAATGTTPPAEPTHILVPPGLDPGVPQGA